jgi:hypothetical protein
MKRVVFASALVGAAMSVVACGGDKATGPACSSAKPVLERVNGVSVPTGLVGMTVMVEGAQLGDGGCGQVYFLGDGGTRIAANVVGADWTNQFVITTVPAGTADTSKIWVETSAGVSDSVDFYLISGSTFSPSNISWTSTSAMPQALQGLGAAFVPVERGAQKQNLVFALGGAADQTGIATRSVYRAQVAQSGALGSWTDAVAQLPAARAFHTVATATRYTAPLDTLTAAHLFVIGGVDETGATVSTVFSAPVSLDGSVGAWKTATALPAAVHAAGAVVFRGYLYVTGGADGQNRPVAAAYRAKIAATGTLGAWETIPALPSATAFHTMVNFGPYLYVVGGDRGTVVPTLNTTSGTETGDAYVGRVNVRDGSIPSWAAVTSPNKARAKHGMITAGGALLVTSGVYSGQAGSSENSYAVINADGTLASWNGATGSNTIDVVLGYALYNEAAVSFVDANGIGHVLVLGGGRRTAPGRASAGVVYY